MMRLSRIPNTAGRGLTRHRRKSPVVRGKEKGHYMLWQRSGCHGTGKGTWQTLAEASQAPETKIRLSGPGDRDRDITYLGGGITGPALKGPVVGGQEKGSRTLAEASQAPDSKVWLSGAALWNRNYFLRFWFRLLKSYGSGSGSNFWKSYGSGSSSHLWKVTVPVLVPVPAPYLDHEKQIFQNKFWKFFCLFT